MASMVAKACSSNATQISTLMAVPDKGSRNKRKFRADSIITSPQNEFSSYEFSVDKFGIIPSLLDSNGCDTCSGKHGDSEGLKLDIGLSCSESSEVEAAEEFHDAEWSDLIESQLEELIMSTLDAIFWSAIRKIMACGYSQEVASKAILRSGVCHGCKDIVSNIVDNTVAFLKNSQEINSSAEHYFENLQQMEEYILAELVCLLREVRPFFSTGDAMWCLLICDMNVSQACAMETEPLNSFVRPQLKIKVNDSDSRTAIDCKSIPETPKSEESSRSLFDYANKAVGGKKVSGNTRRECVLRQKSVHLEKHYKAYGAKGSRSGKISGFGGLLLDKKLKNATLKFNKSAVVVPQGNCLTKSNEVLFPSTLVFGSETTKPKIPLPIADTELSLAVKCDKEKHIARCVTQDKKDEMILKLVPRVRELQSQLQEWTEWANQKVMQATRRLSKDKDELKTLRQESEEVERLRKEKQTLEENTMKKLKEMANALGKASGQVEKANAAVRRLEVENTSLRREMEAAKLRAAVSAASCEEVSHREKKTISKFQSWEKQKTVLQDELAAEKCKLAQLQQKLEQSKELRNQLEARWKQEEKAKQELVKQAMSLRKEREEIEASTKSKEDLIKQNAQSNLQKYKDDIEKLEKEIAQLRLKTDSSKIAALRRGVDGSYASKLSDVRNPTPNIIRPTKTTDLQQVSRERECVMCLSEEMSVVFLPCAHQVVCKTCNELHEKQGMKDCPSCRSPIQRRIAVNFGRS